MEALILNGSDSFPKLTLSETGDMGATYNIGGANMSSYVLLIYFVLGAVFGSAVTLSFCRPSWLYPKKQR